MRLTRAAYCLLIGSQALSTRCVLCSIARRTAAVVTVQLQNIVLRAVCWTEVYT